MYKIKTVSELQSVLKQVQNQGKQIGFVPTMGALHEGHLSLVKQAKDECDYVVVSVFVNPNQFNDPKDLEKYPRDIDRDSELLSTVHCDLLFAPGIEDIYPEEDTRKFEFGALETVMEGRYRPGHFNGVAQVVSRLFDYCNPDKAYFGLKDFQQVAIIQDMAEQLNCTVEIIACPIIREDDGLAMSSRNVRLTQEQRKNAPVIAKTLFDSCNFVSKMSVEELRNHVMHEINLTDEFKVEYFEIVDGKTLQGVDNWEDCNYIVGCIAVFVGEVRLIDNVIYKKR